MGSERCRRDKRPKSEVISSGTRFATFRRMTTNSPEARTRPDRHREALELLNGQERPSIDRKSTRLNSSHLVISYAVFCLKKKKIMSNRTALRATYTTA